jgi:hypothetical protein
MPTSAATIPGRIAQAAGMGAVTGYGMNENRDEALKDIAMGGAIGGAVGGLAEGATLGLKKLGESFGDSAKKLVLKGTGATGKQAEKFKEGTADYLLNSGKFGMFDSPADIARKSDELLEQSGQRIGSIVDEASAAGGKVNRQEILDKLRAKMEQEIRDGNGDSARRLATIVKDLEATPLDDVSLSFAQGQKKKFNDLAKSHALPMDKTGNDLAGSLYNEAVESQIAKTTPELSGAFDAAKAEYGMLKPINQFSTARAQTLNQSPAGGLLDATRAVAGGQVGGIAGMFAAAIGGKALASRAPNMMAHSLNKVSKLIKTPPAMLGKFAPIIQNAAVRGQNAVAVTDWLLEQNNSEYREMKSRLEDGN